MRGLLWVAMLGAASANTITSDTAVNYISGTVATITGETLHIAEDAFRNRGLTEVIFENSNGLPQSAGLNAFADNAITTVHHNDMSYQLMDMCRHFAGNSIELLTTTSNVLLTASTNTVQLDEHSPGRYTLPRTITRENADAYLTVATRIQAGMASFPPQQGNIAFIPSYIRSIENNAFNNKEIYRIDFSLACELNSIGINAFKNNQFLPFKITLPRMEHVISVGENAFRYRAISPRHIVTRQPYEEFVIRDTFDGGNVDATHSAFTIAAYEAGPTQSAYDAALAAKSAAETAQAAAESPQGACELCAENPVEYVQAGVC